MASPRSPLSPRPPPSPGQDDTEAWRAKFVHFYQTNAPSKAKFVNDKMMAKWKGRYKELYSNLERKYGPLGAPTSPPRPPSRPGSGRAFGGRGKRTVADLSSEFEALVNKARRECPDNKAPLDLVDAKLTAAENGLETSTFTVCARIRPKLKQDEGDEDFVCVVPGEHGRAARCLVPRVSITGRPKLDESRSELDWTWGPNADEDNIFDAVGRPLVHRALDGQVGVIFAYGQTGFVPVSCDALPCLRVGGVGCRPDAIAATCALDAVAATPSTRPTTRDLTTPTTQARARHIRCRT